MFAELLLDTQQWESVCQLLKQQSFKCINDRVVKKDNTQFPLSRHIVGSHRQIGRDQTLATAH